MVTNPKMQQFEKWFDKNKGSLFCPILTHRSRSDCEKVWKAALEWIKYAGVISEDLAGQLIDEELGNGKS